MQMLIVVSLLALMICGSISKDILSPNQSLHDGQTLVSTGGTFTLGFFSPRGSKKRYVGIWYNKLQVQTVVWVANRRSPILSDTNGTLELSGHGTLTINSMTFLPMPSVNLTNPLAQLLDNGNLVVRESNSSEFVWQSFDYPTDTLLPGMKLGWDLRIGLNRNLTSWRSEDDPSPGSYIFSMDLQGAGPQLILWFGSAKKWLSGPLFDISGFTNTPELSTLNGFTYWYNLSRDEVYYKFGTGDPISPYLFLLVSQNLSSMLNQAMSLNYIPGFDSRLTSNFNHLLFADDALIITRASRSVAKNCRLCLDLYFSLTGQKVSLSKSTIHFPSWFNRRISRSITRILGMKLGSFPFTYLGMLISPKRLLVGHWQPLIQKVSNSLKAWHAPSLSLAGRSILVNSSLMSIPIYSMSSYPVPDTVLDQISKVSRRFLWGHGTAGGSFQPMNWATTTLDKSEGGLGIRDLRLAKTALMTKNIFALLNNENKFWVQIVQMKYGTFHPWESPNLQLSSWFYKQLCKNVAMIKSNLWIVDCNPSLTNFLNDPWLFDIPVALKPTFLNMQVPFESLNISDMLDGDKLNYADFTHCFGHNLDWSRYYKCKYDVEMCNHWVWSPSVSNMNLAREVYMHLNQHSGSDGDSWVGWTNLWKLSVAPRVKTFIWRLLHGKLPTFELMYSLGFGAQMPCPLCGLGTDSITHLFIDCRIAKLCWNEVSHHTGWDVANLDHLLDGSWLLNVHGLNVSKQTYTKALMATCAWSIWGARCDNSFNRKRQQAIQIFSRALNTTQDHFWKIRGQFREFLHSSIFNSYIHVMCDAAWTDGLPLCGLGFVILQGREKILMAGSNSQAAGSSCQAEIQALANAMEQCTLSGWRPDNISTDCLQAIQIVQQEHVDRLLPFQADVIRVKQLLKGHPHLDFGYCPREINFLADALAKKALSNPGLSLYHRGANKPRWLEHMVAGAGLQF